MNSKTKIMKIMNLEGNGKSGFWTGQPREDTEKIYLDALGYHEINELRVFLKDDCRWINADSCYKHPKGRDAFDPYNGCKQVSLGTPGCFAECESIHEIDNYDWPCLDYLDFSDVIEEMKRYGDKVIMGGMWSPFFHWVAGYFGMENYFVKMYTDPKLVEAVTNHVVDFLCEANERFFEATGAGTDVFFFGNDFGTQLDLMISPEAFKKFILPSIKRLINVAKKHNKKVLLHSCGSIYKVIPMLIDAGIDALHPLQAKAANMDANTLAREFKKDIAFVGGVDTQELLIQSTPAQIKDEVYRLREILGPNYVVSPSHEAILPNVPLENIIAMAEAAKE